AIASLFKFCSSCGINGNVINTIDRASAERLGLAAKFGCAGNLLRGNLASPQIGLAIDRPRRKSRRPDDLSQNSSAPKLERNGSRDPRGSSHAPEGICVVALLIQGHPP